MGGVQDRYLRYEAAGDMIVGRMVSGLPINSAEFSILPPHFQTIDESLSSILNCAFPFAKKFVNMIPIVRHGLASVLYHKRFLEGLIDLHHVLRSSFVFREQINLEVLCGFQSMIMVPTGIPSHVTTLSEIRDLKSECARLPEIILTGVDDILEKKSVSAGSITPANLEFVIEKCLARSNVLSNLASNNCTETGSQEENIEQDEFKCFSWEGKLRRVPEDFKFPIVDVRTAWSLWFKGNSSLQYPPFRHLTSHDMKNSNMVKTLSDWKTTLKFMENVVKNNSTDQTYIPKAPSEDEISAMYDIAISGLPREEESSGRRKRRPGQIKISTMTKKIRKYSGSPAQVTNST